MRNSNLAECLEEFEAAMLAVDETPEKTPSATAPMDVALKRRAARRLSFDSRRIRIRDAGLPRFRVF